MIPTDQATIDYVSRFGPKCRDCADEDGTCPHSGLPCCGVDDRIIKHVIGAINYGLKNGYLKSDNA